MSFQQPSAVQCAPSTAVAVANELLSLGFTEPTVPPIAPMKIQKLLFYAHAWYLADFNSPLFDEDIEAWPWGPVVRDIYIQTKDFGKNPITAKLRELRETESGFEFVIPDGVENTAIKAFVRQIWETHKRYTGVQLSNSTHAKGEPWTIIKEQYGNLDRKPRIPNELIAAVFKKKLENARAASAHSSSAI